MIKDRVVLITGVPSGIGRETAQFLAGRGARVFGTVRDMDRADPIAKIDFVSVDVADDRSIKECVESVLAKAGKIDILINNAGYSIAAALEETSLEKAHQLFETNFFGVLRMIRAVLPSMRQQGHGRIVNVSSMAGVVLTPRRGIYTASKHALEGYTETLDHEIRQFGIRAVLVEPTFTRTKMVANEKAPRVEIPAYAEQKDRVEEAIQRENAAGDDPAVVAKVIYRAVTDEPPQLRYPVGKGTTLSLLRRFVPSRMFDKQFRKRFRLDAVKS